MLKRVKASVDARIVQPWIKNHFEKTKWGKELRAYHNRYAGKRCFLIGNGPSLLAEDLTTLHEHGEITFGFNRIYQIFDQTPWRPDFYVSQDEKVLQGCIDEVRELDLPVKFIPIYLKWYYNLSVDGAIYMNMLQQPSECMEMKRPLLFSEQIEKEIYNGCSCLYSGIQLATYMGIGEIYLIGVDHSFRVTKNNQGEVFVNDQIKDHFSDHYTKAEENLGIANMELSTFTFQSAKYFCEAHGIHVFNATRGGKLEVFPRVSFDTLFARGDT